MQQFQNYYQNPSMMYQNPYNSYERMYQNNIPNGINMQSQNNQGIVGRIVDNFDNITASDVPLDGQPATFIKRDMSEVQLRSWNANGQIHNIVFKPVSNTDTNNSTLDNQNSQNKAIKALEEAFNSNFSNINERFDKLEKAILPKSNSRKKEVVADE